MNFDCGLIENALVLVAVSGGADSLALLHFLRESGYPLLVASFNHQLRPESESDLAHVRQIAVKLGLPFIGGAGDVVAHAAQHGMSIEEAARDLRYRFLFREARQAGAQAVATGHTADDQAETVLMHFLRGAGLSGLKGMLPRLILPAFDPEIALVRPLLGWTRAQTEACCRQNGLAYLTDSSNSDTVYLRNRLRHELLPHLESYNPQIRQSLVKTSLALQGDHDLLIELVDSAWEQAVPAAGAGFVAFDFAQLQAFSPALRRHLFRRAAFALQPALRDVDFETLERAASLSPTALAGGLKTIREGERLYLAESEENLPVDVPQIDAPLPVSTVPFSISRLSLGNSWVLTCEFQSPSAGYAPSGSAQCFLDADLTEGRLKLRPFRAGDRFEPLGMPGKTVKLSDLFVNLKIPQRLRKHWPILCVDDEIVWVAGLRPAERFKVTDRTRRILKLTLGRL